MTIRKLCFTSLLFAAFLVLSPFSAFAKDEWIQVRSKNFYLIGNASEKDVRKVATRLEQFRETFRQVFRSMQVDSPIPTSVIVFKSDSSFKPFKPRRADGKADNLVAGYFQPGEDVNYVTLSTEGTDAETYGTIFHEYVHFLVETNFGKFNVPSWFNEGLAEYYSTFQIEQDQIVKLGYPDANHLGLLSQSKLIPIGDLLNTRPDNWGGSHGRSIFYAQSWALIHYLVQTGKNESLDKFLLASAANKPAEVAFRESFGVGYAEMEKELRKYIGQSSFKYHSLTFKNKLTFDTETTAAPLTEADTNAYLGDLLLHTDRADDAEPFLRTALSLDPKSGMANTALGMVKVRQRKFADAKTFLERASENAKDHLPLFRYAELLMREGQDEFGYASKFEPAKAARMRELLKKAIALKPSFTESYELLAFVSLVTNEHLDEALAAIATALKYRPGHMRYGMRAAEIYLRQDKFKEALSLVEKIAKHADEDEIRTRAERLAAEIKQRQEMFAKYEADKKRYEEARAGSGTRPGTQVMIRRRPGEGEPSPEEMAKIVENATMRSMNESLREVPAGETRLIGQITKIECKGKTVSYSVTSADGSFQLTSPDFQGLFVISFVSGDDLEVGCGTSLAGQTAVITYRPDEKANAPLKGQLIAVEFVPKNFRFVDLKAEPGASEYIAEGAAPRPGTGSVTTAPSEEDFAQERRSAMLQSIAENIRKPGPGEKRVLGFIEKSECTNKGIFYSIKVGAQIVALSDAQPEATFMRAYTRDVEQLRIGCGMKSVDIPVVIVYKESTDKKPKHAGDIISIEFVPASFTLDP